MSAIPRWSDAAFKALLAATVSTLFGAVTANAQVVPTKEAAESGLPAASYSPYANRSFPTQLLWGETHLHTALSLDASAFGNILGPDEAWRFAKGEQVTS